MQDAVFTDTLDEWLATQDRPPAEAAGEGIVQFDIDGATSLAARLLADGRVELFLSPGYLGKDALRAFIEDPDEDDARTDEHGLVPLFEWADGDEDGECEWHLEARLVDGLVVLSRTMHAPRVAYEWAPCVEAFAGAVDEWAAGLCEISFTSNSP